MAGLDPGISRHVTVDRDNTTLYASDRDMFVFLADEDRRIEVAGRSLARGFFVWNSEVGDKTLGAGFFLFDYVCCNRMIWGADQYTEVSIRHTRGAPDRWLDEVVPVLTEYSHGSPQPIIQAIEQAREKRLGDDLDQFSPQGSASAWLSRSRRSTSSRRVVRSRPCST
jgi:hypothetical protein